MNEGLAHPLRLVASNLGCVRGDRPVFNNLSFSISSGELLAIVGRNGAGKSSLLRQIAGLVALASGTLTLEGREPDCPIGEHVHFVGHLDALKPSLSVQENLAFWRNFYDTPWNSVEDSMVQLGLLELAELPVAYLSQGQKRRLTLARLLVSRRPVWLLDEPTAALDLAAQQGIAMLIHTHLEKGGIVVAATHGPLGVIPSATLELGLP